MLTPRVRDHCIHLTCINHGIELRSCQPLQVLVTSAKTTWALRSGTRTVRTGSMIRRGRSAYTPAHKRCEEKTLCV